MSGTRPFHDSRLEERAAEAHKVAKKTAWIVFGIIFVIFAFTSVGSQCAARKMKSTMSPWTDRMEEAGEMSPEEAGKAMGEFFKGLQEATEGE